MEEYLQFLQNMTSENFLIKSRLDSIFKSLRNFTDINDSEEVIIEIYNQNTDLLMYKNLDQLAQEISELLFFVLNDPFYASIQTYKFFDRHQSFQIMPILSKFFDLNNYRQTGEDYSVP